MGAKYTRAQKKAYDTYIKEKARLSVVVSKDKADQYRKAAEAEGKSVSRYFTELADEKLENEHLEKEKNMEEYLVCEIWYYNTRVSLHHARRLNEEEEAGYTEEAKKRMFVALGEPVELGELSWRDVKDIFSGRPDDGNFNGSGNTSYIITEEEWNQLAELNERKLEARKRKEATEQIETYKRIIKDCEKQEKLYTKEEADQKRREWVALYNEGGEGYVPHFYTECEYENAKKKLEELKELLDR